MYARLRNFNRSYFTAISTVQFLMKKRPIQFGGGIFPGQDINTFIKVAIVACIVSREVSSLTVRVKFPVCTLEKCT